MGRVIATVWPLQDDQGEPWDGGGSVTEAPTRHESTGSLWRTYLAVREIAIVAVLAIALSLVVGRPGSPRRSTSLGVDGGHPLGR